MAGKKIFTAEQRFWQRVIKTPSCWEWQRLNDKGYGSLNIDGRLHYSHRFSWTLHNGPIPEGLWVLHKCDNRACVRPDHLFLGTPQDNIDDMWAKNRQKFRPLPGSQNGASKLTEADVALLLELVKRKVPQRVIGRILKISRTNVSMIASGKAWKHVANG